MNFSMVNELLLQPLVVVCSVVERKHSNPILSNVLLSLQDDVLSLTATDSEIELSTSVRLPEPAEEAGEITVPGKKLLDICKSIKPDEQINFRVKGDRAVLKTSKSRFSLVTQAASEFPIADELEDCVSLSIDQIILKDLFAYTSFAMAQQDVRYYLNGLLLELNARSIRTVATDGHRMAMASWESEGRDVCEQELAVIVPRKSVMELTKLFEVEDTAKLMVNDNHFVVEAEHFVFKSKLVDGRFPDYRKVLPSDADNVVVVERDELKDALAQAAVLCNLKYKGVRLVLEAGNLTIYSNNPEQEEAKITIASDYNGESMEMGFNVSYLLDVLSAVRTERVKISFSGHNSSTLFEEQDGNNCRYVVMPMRL